MICFMILDSHLLSFNSIQIIGFTHTPRSVAREVAHRERINGESREMENVKGNMKLGSTKGVCDFVYVPKFS